jgi:hypothetical protein
MGRGGHWVLTVVDSEGKGVDCHGDFSAGRLGGGGVGGAGRGCDCVGSGDLNSGRLWILPQGCPPLRLRVEEGRSEVGCHSTLGKAQGCGEIKTHMIAPTGGAPENAGEQPGRLWDISRWLANSALAEGAYHRPVAGFLFAPRQAARERSLSHRERSSLRPRGARMILPRSPWARPSPPPRPCQGAH